MAKKSPAKIIGIILVIIVVLLVAAGVTLKIMFPPSKLKAMTMPHIEKALGRDVEIERIGLAVFPYLGVKIRNLQIANTQREGFSDEPFVTLEGFIVKVKVLPLLKRDLQIDEIILTSPHILVETDHTGSFNFDDLAVVAKDTTKEEKPEKEKPEGAGGIPVPLVMEKFIIDDGSVIYHDRKSNMKVGLGKINQRVDVSADKGLKDIKTTGELTMKEISFYSKDVPKPITDLVVTFNHDLVADLVEGTLTINEIKASLQEIYIAMTGKVTNFNQTPTLDLAIKTEKLDLANILAEVPVAMVPEIAKTKGSGSLRLDVAVKGELDSAGPDINGTLVLNNGEINYTELPQKISDMNANIAFNANSLNISKLHLMLGANPVDLKAQVENFASPVVDAALNAKVNLDDIKNIIKLPEGNDLGGMITADVQAKGQVDPNDPTKLAVNGDVELQKVRVVTPAVVQPVLLNGSLDFSNDKIAQKLAVDIGKSSMNLTAQLKDYLALAIPDTSKNYPRPMLTFDLNSPYLNTNEILPASEEKETSEDAPEEKSSTQEPGLLLASPLPNLDMKGTITNDHMIYQEMDLRNVKVAYQCINDIIDMTVQANLFGGSFTQDMNANVQNIENPQIENKLSIDGIQVGELITAFKGYLDNGNVLFGELKKLDESLSGKIALNGDLTTHGGTQQELTDNLNGELTARLKDGKIERGSIFEGLTKVVDKFYNLGAIDFRKMKLTVAIADRLVHLKNFDLNSSYGDWLAEGSIGFNSSLDITLKNYLTKKHSKPVAKMENAATGAAKKGLQAAAKASGLAQYVDPGSVVDDFGTYLDEQGRATLKIQITGTVSKPKFSSPTLVRYDSGGKKQEQKPREQIKEKLQDEINQKKKEAEELAKKKLEEQRRNVEAQKKKAAEEAARKKAEAEAKAREEAKKAEQKAKEEAKDAGKNAVKKLKKMF
ncbi:MAG: AsmA family protein [Chitinivibrionales bacterium]|nr:AsmA family protein [Chitinivibrionales bacterium]